MYLPRLWAAVLAELVMLITSVAGSAVSDLFPSALAEWTTTEVVLFSLGGLLAGVAALSLCVSRHRRHRRFGSRQASLRNSPAACKDADYTHVNRNDPTSSVLTEEEWSRQILSSKSHIVFVPVVNADAESDEPIYFIDGESVVACWSLELPEVFDQGIKSHNNSTYFPRLDSDASLEFYSILEAQHLVDPYATAECTDSCLSMEQDTDPSASGNFFDCSPSGLKPVAQRKPTVATLALPPPIGTALKANHDSRVLIQDASAHHPRRHQAICTSPSISHGSLNAEQLNGNHDDDDDAVGTI
eukprot:m.14269 g.14269  ORF g.14269 m.14269 type:complete len:301 (-) comp7574_c0_seq1:44-946(-)